MKLFKITKNWKELVKWKVIKDKKQTIKVWIEYKIEIIIKCRVIVEKWE